MVKQFNTRNSGILACLTEDIAAQIKKNKS